MASDTAAAAAGGPPHWATPVARLAMWLGIAVLAGEAAVYLAQAAFIDHIESTVMVTASTYLHGHPIYARDDGMPVYGNYYGPLAYLAPLLAIMLLGKTVTAGKLLFALAPLCSVGLLAWHARRQPAGYAVPALLMLTLGMIVFGKAAIWLRPDPLETLLVALAVVAAPLRAGPVLVGVCLGLAVNCKPHAFLYLLPVLLDLWQRRGLSRAVLAGAVSLAVFALPFLLPGVSLDDYRAGLQAQVGGRRLDPVLVSAWIGAALMLVNPLVWGLLSGGSGVPRADRRYALAAIAMVLLLGYPSVFPGAGTYHLLPLAPVLADSFARLRPRRVVLAMPLALLLVGYSQTADLIDAFEYIAGMADEAAQAVALAAPAPPGSVQVGYGASNRSYMVSQLARTLLALRGAPVRIDGQSLMELDYVHLDGSRRWVPWVEPGGVPRWVLPHGEAPFAMRSYYNHAVLFDDAFRAAFTAHYRMVQAGAVFDLWQCADCAP